MALADEIAVKLGLKTADFKAALKSANADVTAFKKGGAMGESEGLLGSMKNLTQRVGQFRALLLGGGLITAIRGIFTSAVTYAENYSGALDDNIAAILRLKEASGGLEGVIAKGFGAIARAMELTGIAIGAIVYGTDSAVVAYNKLDEEGKKAFDAKRVKAVGDAEEELRKARAAAALSNASANDRVNLLAAEQVRLLLAQSKVENDKVAFLKLEAEIAKNTADLNKAEADAKKESQTASEELVKLEKQIRDAKLATLSDADQILAMEDELAAAQASILNVAMDANESGQIRLRIAQLELDLTNKRDAVAKAATTEAEKLANASKKNADQLDRVVASYGEMLGAFNRLATAQGDRKRLSLDDVAAGKGGTLASNRVAAREIQRLEASAIRAQSGGFSAIADQRMARAQALRDKLSPVLKSSDADPLKGEKDAVAKESAGYLKDIKAYLEPVAAP